MRPTANGLVCILMVALWASAMAAASVPRHKVITKAADYDGVAITVPRDGNQVKLIEAEFLETMTDNAVYRHGKAEQNGSDAAAGPAAPATRPDVPATRPATRPQANLADFVFVEDFEKFDKARWSNIKGPRTVEIVPGGRRGGHCAQVTATLGENTGGYLYKMIKPGLETAHLRFYVKFEAEHEYVHHFVKLVGYNPSTPWPQGRAGEKPNGRDFFSTGIEPWGANGRHPAPGVWHFYTYYAEMKRSGDGKFWGNGYNPDPAVAIPRDRWICVEVMLKCNTPDQADGEQALWIDGKPAGHWKQIRWRTDPKLNVNGFAIESYITEQSAQQNKVAHPRKTNRCWFDDVVLSRSYVGPDE